ncbi:MAG: MMPL family transporter, partial [Nocardioides sp.]|nr:MMPL family transporter [Nocardioides sp.]
MSVLLHRLGRFAFRRHWFFIAGWMLTLGVVVTFAVANGGGAISASVTIDGTQAQEVLDDLRTEMPAASGGQGTIVFTTEDNRPLGEGAEAEAIARAASGVSELPYVIEREVPDGGAAQVPEGMTPPDGMEVPEGMTPPEGMELPEGMVLPGMDGPRPLVVDGAPVPGVMVSEDGSVAMLQMQFDKQVDDLPEGTVDEVVTLVEDAVESADLNVLPTDSLKAMHPPIGGGEAIGIGVAAVVLVMTLGSLVAAGLPLLTAVTGVGIGLGGALALSQHITMTSSTPVLALMIGLAVGIDYALFIVNRQRRLIITEGLDAHEATGRAVGTAGSAVVFAGTTVIVALVALTVIGIDFLSTMALVAATTVFFAVLIAVTLLPALLGLVGERIVSRRAREREIGRAH